MAADRPLLAQGKVEQSVAALWNGAVRMDWQLGAFGPGALQFQGQLDTTPLPVGKDAFMVTLQDGSILRSGQLHLKAPAKLVSLTGDKTNAKRSAQQDGIAIDAEMADDASGLAISWRGVLKDGSRYVRQEVTLTAGNRDVTIADIRLIDVHLPDLKIAGMVKGSPLVSSNLYFLFEDPASETRLARGHGLAHLTRELPLKAGQSVTYMSVIGATDAGQLRRGFLDYVERERAHPYRAYLHYNSWYDIGYFSKYSEADALDSILGIGTELAEKRGVKLDSFLFDDGWDEPAKLWTFHDGFPHGFAPLAAAAARFGAAPGVWLSPWGGYGKPKKTRIEFGQKDGYETNNGGFALSGPKYFARFREVTLDFLRKGNINHFKIDGTGNVDSAYPGGAFDSDFQAAVGLIREWRRVKPDLYINLTTGTYPSPAWLLTADSIWRGGEDHQFLGVGTWRQRWITYRDADTYANVVMAGPLFPLNSLMLHGIIFAQNAKHLSDDPGDDFADEVHDFFGSGTQLQELYISHRLLSAKNWDVLAESAKWSRAHQDILKDTHWIGGDPALLEVYGWASWSQDQGIVTLRNPSDKPQDFMLDAAAVFELPKGAALDYVAQSPWEADAAQPPVKLHAGKPQTLHLAPLQTLTWEAVARRN